MTDLPTEHYEHTEHAGHAAATGDPFLVRVTVTIAIVAVLAATVGSLETMESGRAIAEKNDSVLEQNRASDTWAFYQARSIKKNLYEIAALTNPDKAAELSKKAARYEVENADIQKKAEAFEARSEHALDAAEEHEHRHHLLTIAATLLHISIAVATIAIVARGRRWPWYASLAMGSAGTLGALLAYLVG